MDELTPIGQLSFVAIDLEAAGMLPGGQPITEIGAARFSVQRDGTVCPGPTMQTLVRPDRPIPPRITELTGIDDALVERAPHLDEVWPGFLDFLSAEESTVLLAHNARSDLGLLDTAARKLGLPWEGPVTLCTALMARETWPEAPRHGLEALLDWRQSHRKDAQHHRALPDALHTRTLFSLIVAEIKPRDLGVLLELGRSEAPEEADHVDAPERLEGLSEAVTHQRKVLLSYRGGSKGKGHRPVTPLGFFRQAGVIYLHAWCHLDEMAKVFRADRIRSFAEEAG